MIALLQVGAVVYFFRSLCLYWDDTGESINTEAKGSVAQTSPAASSIFMFHRHFTPFLCPSFQRSSVFFRCVFPAQIPPTPLFVSLKIKWTKTNSIKLQASEAGSYFSWRRSVSGRRCVRAALLNEKEAELEYKSLTN